MFMLFFFFFQAEDGIRDWSVTGVQTCALPISESAGERRRVAPSAISWTRRFMNSRRSSLITRRVPVITTWSGMMLARLRSEERRVGKEWRSRRSREHKKEIDRRMEDKQ